MIKYKVWIHIEEIDEDKDHYQEIEEPQEAGRFDSEQAARHCAEHLLNQADGLKGLHIDPPPAETGPEPLFRVVYVIDLNAQNTRAAAQETYDILTDPDSMPPVLHILDAQGHQTTIDLSQE
jgi:hypothetical protein